MNSNLAKASVAYEPFSDPLPRGRFPTRKVSNVPLDVGGDEEDGTSVSSSLSISKRPVSHIEDKIFVRQIQLGESHNVEDPSAERGNIEGHKEERNGMFSSEETNADSRC